MTPDATILIGIGSDADIAGPSASSKTYLIVETIVDGTITRSIQREHDDSSLPANCTVRHRLHISDRQIQVIGPTRYLTLEQSESVPGIAHNSWHLSDISGEDCRQPLTSPRVIERLNQSSSLTFSMTSRPLTEVQVNSSIPHANSESGPAVEAEGVASAAPSQKENINGPPAPARTANQSTPIPETAPYQTTPMLKGRSTVKDTPAEIVQPKTLVTETTLARSSQASTDPEAVTPKAAMKDDTQEIPFYDPNDSATALRSGEAVPSDIPSSPPPRPPHLHGASSPVHCEPSAQALDDPGVPTHGANVSDVEIPRIARPEARLFPGIVPEVETPSEQLASDGTHQSIFNRNRLDDSLDDDNVKGVFSRVAEPPVPLEADHAGIGRKRTSRDAELDEENSIEVSYEPKRKRGRPRKPVRNNTHQADADDKPVLGHDEFPSDVAPTKRPKESVSRDTAASDQYEPAASTLKTENSVKADVDSSDAENEQKPQTPQPEKTYSGRGAKRKSNEAHSWDQAEPSVAPKKPGRRKQGVEPVDERAEIDGAPEPNITPRAMSASSKTSERKSGGKGSADQDEVRLKQLRSSSGPGTQGSAAEDTSGQKFRVLFSNSTLPSMSSIIKNAASVGIGVTDKFGPDTFDVLAVAKTELKKTSKLLLAVALGKPVVSDEWVSNSAKGKKLLSIDTFIVKDVKRPAGWSYDPGDTIDRSGLLENTTIIVTPALQKRWGKTGFSDITMLAKALGVKSISAKSARGRVPEDNTLHLGLDGDTDPDCAALLSDNVDCYNQDFLQFSVLRGSLQIDSEEFKITGVGTERTDSKSQPAADTKKGAKGSQTKESGRARVRNNG